MHMVVNEAICMRGGWEANSCYPVGPDEEGMAHYCLTSTIMLSLTTDSDTSGTFNLSGSIRRQMVESFCNNYYIPDEVHPTVPGRDRTITQFPEGKVGVYTSAARVSHFEVLTRVLNLAPSVAVFHAFYTRIYSDGLFSFAKRSSSAPSCLSKPRDSIKNWADHFFLVDSRVFPISVPLYTGGLLEKDPAPHLTTRQEQTVHILSTNKTPFWRYPECFLVLVGLSPYYPFNENTYPAFEGPDKTDMGLLDYIRTADPRKVLAVEVEKGEEQVKLLDSIKHCFVSLDAPTVAQQEGGSGSGAGPEVSAPAAEENVVAEETIVSMGTYLDLMDPEDDLTVAEKGDVAWKQPEKAKRKKLSKQSDTLPAKRLRVDHPSLASGTGGKTLASLRQTIPEGSLALGPSFQADVDTQVTVRSSRVADAPVYTASDTMTSSRGKTHAAPMSDMGGSSQLKTLEESADSFYETAALNSEDAKRWYIPRWNITNDSLLDDGFFVAHYDQLFTEFNVGAARQICLGSEVRSRAEHELKLKEKLRAKCDAQDVLLKGKYVEIARLKSLVKEKETEFAKASRLRDQVSVLTAEKSSLSAEMSTLKSVVSQKETDISLLDSRATYLKSCLDDSQAACTEARNLISALTSERDGLASEVSTLHSAFRDFKERMEAQQEAQAQVLYNRVAELEAHVMDVSGRLEGEFYPANLTTLAGRRWLLTHGVELAMVKCLKSPEYQGILGHALGRAVDFGMQEGLAAGHEHGVAGTPLSAVTAYSPEAAEANYLDAVKALEEADFPLVQLFKSKKDSEMDEVLDCFLLDGPLADLPEAAYLQPCLEQLSVPIYHTDVNAVVGETYLSFAQLNTLVGEASTSAATLSVEDLDTDEDLGSVVYMPQFKDLRYEILPCPYVVCYGGLFVF
ncbi:gypsy type transposase [Tanacetum coccineum]